MVWDHEAVGSNPTAPSFGDRKQSSAICYLLPVTMSWKNELKNNITSIDQIKKFTPLSIDQEHHLESVIERHPMSITRYYLSLIDWTDADDPIKKMIVPSCEELDLTGSYDPSGEIENTKLPGLQHKYVSTALILATNRCAAYCRYCFRKRLVGLPSGEIIKKYDNAVKYIQKHNEINNVLISGGDPLVLPTEIIRQFLAKLSTVEHLHFIRFGTKIPIVFPQRIIHDNRLIKVFSRYSHPYRRIFISTQFNHPRELTIEAIKAIQKLLKAGVIINNQTVLLKGVNDQAEIIADLQSKLTSIGINPYYIFQCRPVKRVKHHFQVSLKRGFSMIEIAKRMLNGVSKRFRYIMSHRTGKIEIVGIQGKRVYLRYHEARDPKNQGKFFSKIITANAGWLDELT